MEYNVCEDVKDYEAVNRHVSFIVGLEKDTWFLKGFVWGFLVAAALAIMNFYMKR